ncbi:MAG: flagellin [Pirellulaceae bacterium]
MLRLGSIAGGFEMKLLGALAAANAQVALSALRISTGKKINLPRDNPSHFVHLDSLQREQSAVQAAVARVNAAANIGSQLQTNLAAVVDQLAEIRTLLLEDADQSLTAAERAANQLEIDAALEQISTFAHTPIEGRNILDGGSNYRVTGQNSNQVKNAQVYSLGSTTSLSGTVTTAATKGSLTYTGVAGNVISTATFTLTGKLGSATISVAASDSLSSAATQINNASYATGVTSSVVGDVLTFSTVDFGTSATLAVNVTSGTFTVAGGNGDGTARGTNALATLGGMAPSNVDGNQLTYARNGTHVQLELVAGYTGAVNTLTLSDSPTLKFALGTGTQQTRLGVRGVLIETLGGNSGALSELATGGSLAGLSTNTAQAIRVVDEAAAQLTVLAGQVDGFGDITVNSTAEFLSAWDENLTTGISRANSVDEDAENLNITRNQNLAANALASLAILQQQQASVVYLVQRLAGLT